MYICICKKGKKLNFAHSVLCIKKAGRRTSQVHYPAEFEKGVTSFATEQLQI